MNRQEFLEIASPPCHTCGEPILWTEILFEPQRNGDGDFVLRPAVMICANWHRTKVEPF